MNGEIDGLLEKFKEMDPETWSRVDKVLGLVVYPRSPLGHYIIQGVIQEAIAARVGWGYSVDCLGNRDDECRYCGLIVGPNTDTDDLEDGWIRVAKASTPATALLAAYIQALEAEASK